MEFIGFFFAILFFLLYLKERHCFARQSDDLSYICQKLETITSQDSREYIRIVSDHNEIRKTAAGINRLLSLYYQEQTEYEIFRKNMQQMVTNISHDLKTPLTVLNGYTEILLQKAENGASPEEIRLFIRRLRQKTEEVVRCVNQFFSMAKLESGDHIFRMENIDLGRLCRETMLEFYDLLEEQQFSVLLPEPDRPVYVRADPDAVTRILKNLIDNAVKYGGEGRFLGISVCEKEEWGVVSVTDHGGGITADGLEHIFKRTHRETGKSAGGSGLGLSISKTLAERMGGRLSAESCPGNTVFTLTLPKEAPADLLSGSDKKLEKS